MNTTLRSLFPVLLSLCLCPAWAQCDAKTFSVRNLRFQQIPSADAHWTTHLRNAFVWVDDINSGFVGGHKPFEVYVVVGAFFPPFSTPTGKLSRSGFLELTANKSGKGNNRIFSQKVEPLPKGVKGSLKFQVDNESFYLQIGPVTASAFVEDKVEFRLCPTASAR